MKDIRLIKHIDDEALLVADFICLTGCTIREAAFHLGMTKSTVYNRIERTLCEIDNEKYQTVRKILDEHYAERGIRGAKQRTLNMQKRK